MGTLSDFLMDLMPVYKKLSSWELHSGLGVKRIKLTNESPYFNKWEVEEC
jgi:hypothetical protein